jgi:hypothetical protein
LQAFSQEDYGSSVDYDRRDLHQKMIDAGRECEYPYALDAQSRFARDYYRNGLNNVLRSLNDNLLADVEQRFKTHVYGGTICAGLPKTEIEKALQENVVDPILAKYRHVDSVNAQTVMRAMYYLAEKCFISWDQL